MVAVSLIRQLRDAHPSAEPDLEDQAVARTRQAERRIDLGPSKDARFPDALAGKRRQDALKEVAVLVDGGLTEVAQPQLGKPVA